MRQLIEPTLERVVGPKPQLPKEALETLESIIDDYDRLARDAPARDPGDEAAINRIRGKREEDIWWTDLALAEQCATHMLRKEQLPSRLAGWRRRLQEVAGRDRYAMYLATATGPAETDEQKLRGDLEECMRAVYYFYSSYGIAAHSRNEVTKSLLKAAAWVIVVELAVLSAFFLAPLRVVPPNVFQFVQWIVAVSIAGVLGSVVSVQRRLQDPASASVDPIYRYVTTTADWFGTSVVSPIFGAVFGALMYALLGSKLLGASLIHFTEQAAPLVLLTPSTQTDGAVLLVLGFISGFAEQLIPDALTRVASRALGGSEAETTTSAPLTPPHATQTTDGVKASAAGSNGKSLGVAGAASSTTALAGVPQLTPEAAARGQDATLASEAFVNKDGA